MLNHSAGFRSKEEWVTEVIGQECQKGGDKQAMAGFLVGGVITALSGNGIAGLAAGAAVYWLGIKKIYDTNHNACIALQNEVAAPFLETPAEFHTYLKQFGSETVLEELKYADQLNASVSPVAADWYSKEMKLRQPETKKGLSAVLASSTPAPAATPEPAAATPEPAAAALAADFSTVEGLAKFLKHHENGWLWDLIDHSPRVVGQKFRVLPPVMIVGAAGSYKSYFAAFIALARALYKNHGVRIIDPHGHKNRDKAWKCLVDLGTPLFGSGGDYEAIANQIDEFVEGRCKAEGCDETPRFTPIWDELTNYNAMKPTRGKSDLLVRMVASDARKLGECPLIVTHSDTNEGLGGSKGMQAAISRGFIKIRLDTDSVNGSPLFKGIIEYPIDSRGQQETREISFSPEWLNPKHLVKVFSIVSGNPTATPEPAAATPEPAATPEANKSLWERFKSSQPPAAAAAAAEAPQIDNGFSVVSHEKFPPSGGAFHQFAENATGFVRDGLAESLVNANAPIVSRILHLSNHGLTCSEILKEVFNQVPDTPGYAEAEKLYLAILAKIQK